MTDKAFLAPALGRVTSGLFILSTGSGDQVSAFLASWVQQAGFDPPAVTVAVQQDRAVLEELRRNRHFCISILSPSSAQFLKHFAAGFEPGVDPFSGVEKRLSRNGVPYLAQAHAHLECELLGDAGWSDHVIVCGEVIAGECADLEEAPLTHVRRNGLSY